MSNEVIVHTGHLVSVVKFDHSIHVSVFIRERKPKAVGMEITGALFRYTPFGDIPACIEYIKALDAKKHDWAQYYKQDIDKQPLVI